MCRRDQSCSWGASCDLPPRREPPPDATDEDLDVFNDFYMDVDLPEVAERRHALRAVRYKPVGETALQECTAVPRRVRGRRGGGVGPPACRASVRGPGRRSGSSGTPRPGGSGTAGSLPNSVPRTGRVDDATPAIMMSVPNSPPHSCPIAGTCCVMQWIPPPPRRISRAATPIARRPGSSWARSCHGHVMTGVHQGKTTTEFPMYRLT